MRILFQGDSITDVGRTREDGRTTSLGQGYPLMIAGDLGAAFPGKYEFYNRGISGDRVVDLYARVKRDCWNLNPDVLSILIGVNDVWHEAADVHNGVDAERFEKIYRIYIEDTLARFPNLKIMILEPFVLRGTATDAEWSYFGPEVPLRAAAAKRVAKDYGLIFVPLQFMFDEACKNAPASYWLLDGVHPSPFGHRLISNAWIKAFRENI
ncbi:MAG: SGNH/GDSL hydrolase family protein [Clostridiaceae bacterium]|nr:SGNH/GDSL hydrolase family protein [Clostridiaceae bacterium]